jgi:hypothetical protein
MLKAIASGQLPDDVRERLSQWEHPEFTAFVIDALYRDPRLAELSGRTLIGAGLGWRYGITDVDGKRPVEYRETMGSPVHDFMDGSRKPSRRQTQEGGPAGSLR